MSVDFLSKNFPPFQVHHAKKPPRFYPDGFQRNVIDFYFIFSDCRLRKALYLQFSYFIWPLSTKAPTRRRRVAAQSLDGNAPVYNEIPALASGAVIPPNRKFLAVLGDQKSGTNVEAPLSTIKQAVMEAMAQGSREPINVNLVVDGKTLARVVVPNINNMTRAAGKPVLLY